MSAVKKLGLFFLICISSISSLDQLITSINGTYANSDFVGVEEKSVEIPYGDRLSLKFSEIKKQAIRLVEAASFGYQADRLKLKKLADSWGMPSYVSQSFCDEILDSEKEFKELKKDIIQHIADTKLLIETPSGEIISVLEAECGVLKSAYLDIFLNIADFPIVPMRYFDSVFAYKVFLDKVKSQKYDNENIEEVQQFLEVVDYLGLPEEYTQRYAASILAIKPLLLYQLYKDRKSRADGSEKLIEAELLKIVPYSMERLGTINNRSHTVGHIDWVSSVIAIDDHTVASTADDHTVIIWQKNDDGTWQLSQVLGGFRNLDPRVGHTNFVKSIAVVDQRTLVTVSDDHTAIIWQKSAEGVWSFAQRLGECKGFNPEVGHVNSVKSVAVLNDHTFLTAAHDRRVIVWQKNAEGVWYMHQQLGVAHNNDHRVGHILSITGIAVIDDDTFATSSLDCTVIIWCRSQHGAWYMHQRLGQLHSFNPAVGHVTHITSLAVLDSSTIASASDDRTVIIWQKRTNGTWCLKERIGQIDNRNALVGHTSFIKTIATSGPRTIMTGGFDNTIIVWCKDVNGRWCPVHLLGARNDSSIGHGDVVLSVAAFKGDMIVSGSWDTTVIVWQRDSIEDHFEQLLQDDGKSFCQKMVDSISRSLAFKSSCALSRAGSELGSYGCSLM